MSSTPISTPDENGHDHHCNCLFGYGFLISKDDLLYFFQALEKLGFSRA